MKKYFISIVILFFVLALVSFEHRSLNVYLIAHSISTRVEAKKTIKKNGWNLVENLKDADNIFVVCRSGLYYPLSSSYKNVNELDEAADGLLNITGSNYHFYLYSLNRNGSVSEDNHKYYEARD